MVRRGVVGLATVSLISLSVALAVPGTSTAAAGASRTVGSCSAPRAHQVACVGLVRKAEPTRMQDTDINITPAQLQSAYGVTSAAANDGKGERVYVDVAYGYPTAESDLATYRQRFALPACSTASGCFQVLNQEGQTSPLPPDSMAQDNDDWSLTDATVMDAISVICPNCDITLIEAQDDSGDGLMVAAKEATTLGARFVALPWGFPEYPTESSDDSTYLRSKGVVYLAAAGNNGYSGGTFWPQSSPDVVAVGGTTLTPASDARGWTETAWTTTYDASTGCSKYESKPSWQSGISDSVCATRASADVAALADPDDGFPVYDTSNSNEGLTETGGTDLSAAIVIAMWALAGPTAPASQPAAVLYANANELTDITSGSTGTCTPTVLCTAGVGWDGPTGLGSPYGLAAFRGTPDTTSLTMTRGATVPAGKSVTLTTMATDTSLGQPIAGVHLQLLSMIGGSSTLIGGPIETTDSAGFASAKVSPSHNTVYEWRITASSANAAFTSPTATVKVSQVVALSAKPARTKPGKAFAVYGAVSPSASGEKLSVEQLRRKSWGKVGSATLKRQKLPSGKTAVGYVLSLKEKKKGKDTFRVVAAATKVNAAGVSKPVTITIR
jgi:hypothetical protein